jgi:hypothetical protein
MSKNTEIKFIGQPIFKLILNLGDSVNIESLVRKHNSDYYYKAFKSRTHLITMLFGIMSRCDSMTEICEGMRTVATRSPEDHRMVPCNWPCFPPTLGRSF